MLQERAHAHPLRQGGDAALRRADEGAAGLDGAAGLEVVVEHPPADPVARLDAQHVDPAASQPFRGDEPGDAGADHDHVGAPGERSLPAGRLGVGCVEQPGRQCAEGRAGAAAQQQAAGAVEVGGLRCHRTPTNVNVCQVHP